MGAGSGVIVDPSGVILTNNHVVAGGGDITVRLHDGREFKGVDIKTDPMTDLAIVRIKASGKLPFARLGDSKKIEVGDWVLAIGQPFGLEGTVTAGIISAKDRGLAITDRGDSCRPTPPSTPAIAAARWSRWTATSSGSIRPFPPAAAAIKASASRYQSTSRSGSADNW